MSESIDIDEATSPIPTLPTIHSGIPPYLLEKAQKAKDAVFETRSKGRNERRREVPVIPQGIERDDFLSALAELKTQLGEENVQVNDTPLVDGWYMERMSVSSVFQHCARRPDTHV